VRDDIKNVVKGAPYDDLKLNLGGNGADVIKSIRFSEIMGEPNTEKKYDEITDAQKLYLKADYYLEDYNMNTKRPMNLVLFEFAIDHAIRITRMLRMAQGHGLLIGLGGSGRMSMTYLASHIRDVPIFQIEASKSYGRENWK
jgi:dynein heavy chain